MHEVLGAIEKLHLNSRRVHAKIVVRPALARSPQWPKIQNKVQYREEATLDYCLKWKIFFEWS